MAFADLKALFDQACRQHPDLMESHVILLADANGEAEEESIMRRALRETIRKRHPLGGEAA